MDDGWLIEQIRMTLAFAKRMRGETTDEDLAEKMIWRLEDIVETYDGSK